MTNQNIDDLSIKENSRADFVASAAKATLGALPVVGPFFAELAGNVIPSQRMDRVVKYATFLSSKISDLEQELVSLQDQLSDEYFTDLVEESLRQAAQSLTDERRNYIASLVANSISSDDLQYCESKHLLQILGALNDIEIIWLKYYSNPQDEEFAALHERTLEYPTLFLGSPQETVDMLALKDSYLNHLASLGLLERMFDIKDDFPATRLTVKSHEITSLGRLFLREVGLS